MKSRLLTFGVVGSAAAAVHFSIVSLIVPLGLAPLIANIVGFLGAFGVSFLGHHHWSFPSKERTKTPAAVRFFIVAVTSFALNETLYWLLLLTGLDYRIALVLVLIVVALLTFMLSWRWAFADG